MKKYADYSGPELVELRDKLTAYIEENANNENKLSGVEIIAQLEQCDNENAKKLLNQLVLLGPKGQGKVPEKYAKEVSEALGLNFVKNENVFLGPEGKGLLSEQDKKEINKGLSLNKISELRKEDSLNANNANKLK